MRDFDFFLDSASRSSGEPYDAGTDLMMTSGQLNSNPIVGRNPSYRYSPETTTDYEDSNCGDLDSK